MSIDIKLVIVFMVVILVNKFVRKIEINTTHEDIILEQKY